MPTRGSARTTGADSASYNESAIMVHGFTGQRIEAHQTFVKAVHALAAGGIGARRVGFPANVAMRSRPTSLGGYGIVVTRDEAWQLLNEYMSNPNLTKHELAVEAAMRAYARRFHEDEALWGIVGLLHDFDYERYPDMAQHSAVGASILAERGYPPEVVHAVRAHNPAHGEPRSTLLDRTLFAVDELTGLIVAVALVRPSKSVLDVDVPAVRRKWNDGAFARGVNRADVEAGAADLWVDLEEHIQVVLEAMQGIAAELGLAGKLR